MVKYYTKNDFLLCLHLLGVKNGDCLFVHSALKGLGKFIPDNDTNPLESLLDGFFSTIGKTGTLVVPTFNFSFCKGEPFDIKNTPGDGMGVFSEYIRTHPNSFRAKHPFHSVAAIGKNAVSIANAEGYSEFSEGSFFDLLLELKCKILFFGIDFVETFVHIAEERAKVPYRFWKKFTGDFISEESIKRVTVNFYARKIHNQPEPRVDIDKINEYLRENNIIKSINLGSGTVSICNSNEMVNKLIKKFQKEPLFPLKK